MSERDGELKWACPLDFKKREFRGRDSFFFCAYCSIMCYSAEKVLQIPVKCVIVLVFEK